MKLIYVFFIVLLLLFARLCWASSLPLPLDPQCGQKFEHKIFTDTGFLVGQIEFYESEKCNATISLTEEPNVFLKKLREHYLAYKRIAQSA